MTVPIWAWIAFAGFVVTMLAVDLLVLHRRAREVSLKEAAIWSAVWVAIGLGFGGLLWAWRGAGPAQAYLAGYLIEKSLSLDNVFVFAVFWACVGTSGGVWGPGSGRSLSDCGALRAASIRRRPG